METTLYVIFIIYNERKQMKLTIIRIEDEIVTCELEDGSLLDIARRWFNNNIKEQDVIEFDVNKK